MPIPVISVSQMREWEQATWHAGITEESVIERVGKIVATRLLEQTKEKDRVLLLAGKGNNGNDVRQTLPHLHHRNAELVDVLDPKEAFEELETLLKQPPEWIVDGLFGIGLNRSLDENWQRAIRMINESGAKILSVDSPSGLNVETGTPEGAAIHSTLTLTLGAAKRGLLKPSAITYVGRLEVAAEIGLVPCPCTSDLLWTEARDFLKFPPARKPSTHKGSYGHLGIIAGSMGYHGAAVLATRAAMKARPGLITLQTCETVYVPVASQIQAGMVRPWKAGDSIQKKFSALLIGPGLAGDDVSAELKRELKRLWTEAECPLIADASALDWLPPGKLSAEALRVITPHPGEAARMLGVTTNEVQENREIALKELSRKYGNCEVILKGHQTRIGKSSGPIFVNSTGNPGLAQGGSGDVLAGFLGGLLAQHELQQLEERTLHYAVWEHGSAADRLETERRSWTVEEMIDVLGKVAESF